MTSDHSSTQWIAGLRAGDTRAVEKLWERYRDRLAATARKRLPTGRQRTADEEDVALSAFDTFFRAVQADRFPRLADRNDLWRLLAVIVARKAARHIGRECRLKRGGGLVLGESALPRHDRAEQPAGLTQIPGREPDPQFLAQAAEEVDRLLNLLGDDTLRELVLLKLEGSSHAEIAEKLDCSLRTVERRLRLVRTIWNEEKE